MYLDSHAIDAIQERRLDAATPRRPPRRSRRHSADQAEIPGLVVPGIPFPIRM